MIRSGSYGAMLHPLRWSDVTKTAKRPGDLRHHPKSDYARLLSEERVRLISGILRCVGKRSYAQLAAELGLTYQNSIPRVFNYESVFAADLEKLQKWVAGAPEHPPLMSDGSARRKVWGAGLHPRSKPKAGPC